VYSKIANAEFVRKKTTKNNLFDSSSADVGKSHIRGRVLKSTKVDFPGSNAVT